MSKNAIIGLVAAGIIVIGGALLLIGTSPSPSAPYGNGDTAQIPSPAPAGAAKTTVTTTTSTSNTRTPGAPVVLTNPNFIASSSTASVTGQVTPNGAPTTYRFEYNEAGGTTNKTPAQSIGSGYSAISSPAFITGLKANTTYSFRVTATNSFGTVYGSSYSFTTNSDPAPTAAVPSVSTASATSVSRTSARLNGQVNPNGWETNYWFEYGTSSNLGNITPISSVSEGSVSLRPVSAPLSELEPLTKYYFRLNAQNKFGTVTGSTLSFTTSGPRNSEAPTVTTTSASNIAANSAQLNGQINPNGADTTYWFEYGEDSLLSNIIGNGTPVQNLNAGTTAVTVQASVSNLKKSTKYFYRLVGKNQHGTTDGSILSFTTKP